MKRVFPRTRDYPKEIFIKDHVWDLKFCRSTPDDRDPEDLGLCDPSTKTIYVRYKQPARETFMTVVHEWLHMVEDEYEIEIGHKIIHVLEEAIADFLEKNF